MFLIFKPVPGIQIVEGSVRSESGKKIRRMTGGEGLRGGNTVTPYPTPSLFFPDHISLHCPINLNTWNRLLVFFMLLKLIGAPF